MLNVSIVLYNHSPEMIRRLTDKIRKSELVDKVFLIDNSEIPNNQFSTLTENYIFTGKNLGYGKAHNIALKSSIKQNIPYHLVVNPDIEINSEKTIENIISFMNNHTDVGLLMPKVVYPNGDIQYLCRLLPKPKDLIFRRFVPKSWNENSNEISELRFSNYDKIMDVPFLSGSFMLLRTKTLEEVGLFDERFFMYGEDTDLSRRIHQKYRTVFYPNETVVHHHERASYKNIKMLFVHIWNITKYFNKWGWIFDKERNKINKKVVDDILQLNEKYADVDKSLKSK